MGVIPTRTPEGEPAECPVCGAAAYVTPSAYPVPDATCANCGSLLMLSGDSRREVRLDPDEPALSVECLDQAVGRGAERFRELQARTEQEWMLARMRLVRKRRLPLQEVAWRAVLGFAGVVLLAFGLLLTAAVLARRIEGAARAPAEELRVLVWLGLAPLALGCVCVWRAAPGRRGFRR